MESFSIFDIDGDGEISVQELMSVMASVGNELSNEDAEDIFEIVDSNGKYFPSLTQEVVLIKRSVEKSERISRRISVLTRFQLFLF